MGNGLPDGSVMLGTAGTSPCLPASFYKDGALNVLDK